MKKITYRVGTFTILFLLMTMGFLYYLLYLCINLLGFQSHDLKLIVGIVLSVILFFPIFIASIGIVSILFALVQEIMHLLKNTQ